MSEQLDSTHAAELGKALYDSVTDEGFSRSEVIPALVQAIIIAAGGDDSLLDQAANLLADGGVDDIEPSGWGV